MLQTLLPIGAFVGVCPPEPPPWTTFGTAVVCREGGAPKGGEVVYLSGKVHEVRVTLRPEAGSIKFKWPDLPIEQACARAVSWFKRKTEGREDVL